MKYVLQNMRYYRRNFIAVSIAIILGVAFVSISVQAGAIIEQTVRNTVAVQYAGADIIVSSFNGSIDDDVVTDVREIDGVATAEKRVAVFGDAQAGSRSQYTILAPVPDAESIKGEISLKEGRLPQATGEVVLLSQLADHLNVGIGDEVGLTLYSSAVSSNAPVSLKVVGIVTGSNALAESSAPDMYGWPEQVVGWSDEFSQSTLLVTTYPTIDPDPILGQIGELGPGDLIPRTLDQQIDFVVADISDGVDVLGYGLLAFAIIALFVCGMVITNTFSILIAQRSRNLGLLRCVGATSSQIRRSVLTEAVFLGTLASLIGIVGGLALTSIATRILADRFPASQIATDVGIPLAATIVPFILGFAATMLAAYGPANAATRVAPLAVLRPSTAMVQRNEIDLKRLILTVLLIGGGSFLLLVGVVLSSATPGVTPLLVGMSGGMLTFLGVLVGSVMIVPRVMAGMGRLVGLIGGAPAFVASSNTSRNPKRANATASAMLIAVTLITMMSVGAATVRSTVGQLIDDRSPIDLTLSSQDFYATGESPIVLPPEAVRAIDANPDISTTTPAIRFNPEINDVQIPTIGIDPDQLQTISRAEDQLDGFTEGVALIPEYQASSLGVSDGESIIVRVGELELSLTALISPDWNDEVLVSFADATELVPSAEVSELWLRFEDSVDVESAMTTLQDSLEPFERIYIEGGAQDKAANYRVLDTLLLIVTALLAVAVVIAIVGVGNTLSLSVIERTRESAILRAIGLTVGQLRIMLAIEGILLALVGSVLGIVLGTIYGYAGAVTLLGSAWGVQFAVPYERIGLIVVIAIAAGLLASVLPAQRAIRTSPVEALAE